MKKILHCADLHLCSEGDERDYSMGVLDEIVSLTLENGAEYLVFAGDTFNSFNDAGSLKELFKEQMKRLEGKCAILLLPGNHEDIGRKKRSLTSFDLGIPPDHVLEKKDWPYILKRFDDIEFLAIPHQEDYRDYNEWQVPPKEVKTRIAIAHGSVVPGIIFTGTVDDEEEKASVIDLDLFVRHGVDYAAMGHIHSGIEKRVGSLIINYPGSARVWRASDRETGPRKVSLVEIESTITVKPLVLSKAGQYRPYRLFVSFDGNIEDLSGKSSDWGENDIVSLEFFGVVENEYIVSEAISILKKKYAQKVRIFNIEKNIYVLEGVSGQPIARKFLEMWEAKAPDKGDEEALRSWYRSRELGLLKIREVMESRS
jgi:exonuclease SbcD